MRLHQDYVPVFLQWLESQNSKPTETNNAFNPKYRWAWLGNIYWAYETGQGLQVHTRGSTDTIKENFISAIKPEEPEKNE